MVVWVLYLIGNVLVAVDGSENSERALDFALDFAEKYAAALTVVNVSESSAVAAFTGDGMVSVARDLRRFHEEILEKALAHAKNSHPSMNVSTSLREGDPASEIVAAATEGNFDVVVVGHRGLGKVKGMFLGSISEKVTRSLTCTVVLVR
jgi:nucleotide-binding universal stress UspA family protein